MTHRDYRNEQEQNGKDSASSTSINHLVVFVSLSSREREWKR